MAPRPSTSLPPDTHSKALRWGIAAVVAAALAGFYWAMPDDGSHTLVCPLRWATGWSCPGCGLQRALHALLHGRMAEACAYNLYLLLVAPYLGLLLLRLFLLTGRTQQRVAAFTDHPFVVGFVALSAIAWMVVRNLLGI